MSARRHVTRRVLLDLTKNQLDMLMMAAVGAALRNDDDASMWNKVVDALREAEKTGAEEDAERESRKTTCPRCLRSLVRRPNFRNPPAHVCSHGHACEERSMYGSITCRTCSAERAATPVVEAKEPS